MVFKTKQKIIIFSSLLLDKIFNFKACLSNYGKPVIFIYK